MEERKPGLNVRLSLSDLSKIELIDDVNWSDDFKKDVLCPYLRRVYEDLASRTKPPRRGIAKTTLLSFLNLQGFMGDRIFHLYDQNDKGRVDLRDFTATSSRLFDFAFDSKLRLVFDLFDGDRDGWINGTDIQDVLSHIPLEQIRTSSGRIKTPLLVRKASM